MTDSRLTMTSAQAATALGVSTRQIRRLLESGELSTAGSIGRNLLIDSASVHRLQVRGSQRGRPLTENAAWAAIELLRDGSTDRLSGEHRSRLRARLRKVRAEELVRITRHRAKVVRYRATTAQLAAVRDNVALTAESALGADADLAARLGLAAGGDGTFADGYVVRGRLPDLVDQFFLIADVRGNVTLHVTEREYETSVAADIVAVALDLAETADIRARSAALDYLLGALSRL